MSLLSHDPSLSAVPIPVDAVPPPLPTKTRGTLSWLAHLCILSAYIITLMVTARFRSQLAPAHPAVGSVAGVLWQVSFGTPLFALVCAAAWLCSRATLTEWRLRWRGGLGPLWLGILYSVGMRVALFVVTVGLAVVVYVFHLVDPQKLNGFRPQVENAVSIRAMTEQPLFYWLVVTLLSAFAGVTEEVWRGGMLAGLAGAFPQVFGGRRGPWLAIVPVAALFGMAHLYMGWPMVAMAVLLGVMLGAMMVWHRTIWHAAIAHALFDAVSFAALPWLARHAHLAGS